MRSRDPTGCIVWLPILYWKQTQPPRLPKPPPPINPPPPGAQPPPHSNVHARMMVQARIVQLRMIVQARIAHSLMQPPVQSRIQPAFGEAVTPPPIRDE